MSAQRSAWRCLMTGGLLLPLLLAFAPGGGAAAGGAGSGDGSTPGSGPVVARSYTVTDLGTLGGSESRALAINNRGQVVGSSTTASPPVRGTQWAAFIYDKANGMRLLSPPDYFYAEAYDINEAGQVTGPTRAGWGAGPWVGTAFVADGTRWNELQPPSGSRSVNARAVNAAGQIVGTVWFREGYRDQHFAFLYDGTTLHDLTRWIRLPGYANGINDAGQVVGYTVDPDSNNYRAFLLDGTTARDLGTLGGQSAVAWAINERGHVVGEAGITGDRGTHAFLHDGITMHDLGKLGSMQTQAFAINVWDQVVGMANAEGKERAFICSNGVMRDLNDMIPDGSGWRLTAAYGINDHGQIVGIGRIRDDNHAFLLDPRPEGARGPSSPAPPRVEPEYVQFGDQAVGVSSAPRHVQITNAGREPLAIESVTIAGPWSEEYAIVSGGEPGALAPGTSRTLQITFTPKAAGRSSATLKIEDDASTKAHLVPLYGLGAGPALQVGVSALGAPSDVDFGDQPLGTSSAARTLTLTNTGRGPLKVRRITLTGTNRGDFRVAGAGGTITLPPSASRSLTIRFTPMALGARGTTVRIEHSADSRPYLVALTGTGTLSLGDGSGDAGAPAPRRLELWVAAGSAAPTRSGKIRVTVGQCVTLKLRVQYSNGATADVTEDPRTRFMASPAGGSFSPTNVWCPGSADAGRSFTLSGEFAPWQGITKYNARATVTVRSAGKHAR